jgi:hypothetical protein
LNLSRFLPLVAAAALLAGGCGGGAGKRDATLWVTRDRGATTLKAQSVRSGLTAAQALESAAKVKTAYSGEFITGIDGVESADHRDWFVYVNGYASDRGATDYVLHPGDVEWWDYRSWGDPNAAPLVAGAFPEPFLHGFDGKRRPAAVRFGPGEQAAARALARVVGASSLGALSVPAPKGANLLVVERGGPRLRIRYRAGHGSAGDPVEVDVGAYAAALARHPRRYARRYSVP